jgi:hypothetical protein
MSRVRIASPASYGKTPESCLQDSGVLRLVGWFASLSLGTWGTTVLSAKNGGEPYGVLEAKSDEVSRLCL